MRCYICDRALETPQYNEDHKDYEPCETCMAIINDLVDGDKDNVTAEDEDLSFGDSTDTQLTRIAQEGYPEEDEESD